MWQYYLDVRMSAMSLTIHTVLAGDYSWYEALLDGQDDKDVPDESCTSKATPFTGMIAGGLTAWIVAQLYRGERVGKVLCLDLTRELKVQTI